MAVVAITGIAAYLRLSHLGSVPGDPFYDAAVRSMGLSWHNFFFGAFEPDGSVSIDKPPVDLWLQVLSVKLFGFSSFALKLPEALASTLAVPLLYAAVRRPFGRGAGLAAALALAVLPISVITGRSDTMDGLMMMLIVVALFCCVRASETGRIGWLLLGAAALGVAFNVKLLESVVPLPGLALLAYLGLPGARRRRLLYLLAASAVYVVVALSWLTATLLFPAHDRPYAIGSTNGSAWNAAFVFNGSDRVSGTSTGGTGPIRYGSTTGFPTASQADRDHIPITAPSATRLLTTVGPLSGQRLGLELLAAVLLGVPALLAALFGPRLAAWRAGPRARTGPGDARAGPGQKAAMVAATANDSAAPGATDDDPAVRMRRALAAGLLVWLLTGIVLFSEQARLHPRYVDAFTPAVAAVLGIGIAWATEQGHPRRLAWLAAAVAILVIYAERLTYGTIGSWWVMAFAGALTLLAAGAALLESGRRPGAPALLGGLAAALVLAAVLAVPLTATLRAVRQNISDAGHVGALPGSELRLVSAYLRAHQGSSHFEVAAASATGVGSLIEKDVRPVLVLTTYNAQALTPIARLRALIGAGAVRYAFLNTGCGSRTPPIDAGCSTPSRWIRAHAVDVSRRAGLPTRGVLWFLPRSIA